MPKVLTLAVAQSRTLGSTSETLSALESTTCAAAQAHSADLILFPEAFLGGYPRTCSFGAAVGSRNPTGREQFLNYFHAAIDLGDTPAGAGDEWVERKLSLNREGKIRGDGTREELERIARETGVFIVTGVVEKAAGSLYCAVLYVCPRLGVIGKRRKVMPTGTERLIWAQGSPATLRAVVTTIKEVRLTLAAAICWENYMPLLRHSLYSQNVNLYLAPTADPRETWLPLMQTVGVESRAFVLSANQCVTRGNLPDWIRTGQGTQQQKSTTNGHPPQALSTPNFRAPGRRNSTLSKTVDGHEVCWPTSPKAPLCTARLESLSQMEPHTAQSAPINGDSPYFEKLGEAIDLSPTDSNKQTATNGHPSGETKIVSEQGLGSSSEFVSRGGSCIVSPMGEVLAGPLWEVEDGGVLVVEADFEDCERGRLDLDVAGSYSRSDSFKLSVEGLDLSPPP